MKPIRLNTIGKVVWFFLIVIFVLIVIFIISLFKKDKPEPTSSEKPIESEKIIDYTTSKNYIYDFSNNRITSDIVIKESGSYKLSGNDELYKIVVDSPSAVVKIVLSNFSTNIVDNLIVVKNVHNLIIEVEDGTENSIESYAITEDGTSPIILKTKSDVDFVGSGKLLINTSGNFLQAQNVTLKNSSLELNNVKNGFKLDGDLIINSGNLYIKSSGEAINSKGNVKIEDGLLVVRANTSIVNDGLFIINKGKVFMASINEIKKPNADSLQKTIMLNFKEITKKMFFVNDTSAFILAYVGEIEYQHILYSDEFKTNSLILYETGKVSGEQNYGLYKIEEAEAGKELTCESLTSNQFEIKDIVNIFDDVVKK